MAGRSVLWVVVRKGGRGGIGLIGTKNRLFNYYFWGFGAKREEEQRGEGGE